MPSKRQRTTRTFRQRVTDAAVAAYKAGDDLTLCRELRLPPWQISPLQVDGDCPWPAGTGGAMTWPDSVALRDELEPACHAD